MADKFTKQERSTIMSNVRNRNTAPEILVRRVLHKKGYRFRLHRKDLPGKPDIALPKHKKAIFVHGCFWHGHEGCSRGVRPTSNVEFWNAKIDKSILRDNKAVTCLKSLGWDALVVWQCQTSNLSELESILESFLHTGKVSPE
jgi:DNA mismatch endonuclease (patch repair protein)